VEVLQPPGWPRPKGYANGLVGRGRLVFVAGQIGWDAKERVVSDDLVAQARQALSNVLAVVAEAGGGPEHIARLTWYVTDRAEYVERRRELGHAYRAVMGDAYPAMSLLEVKGLLEPGAVVEIEATALLPD
jgi:enamine deaminase RidA (YjgF/YER057c/UK114 family)